MATGYVSFVDPEKRLEDLRELLGALTKRETVNWTLDKKAQRGDLVVFYLMEPICAFLASGRVVRRTENTWDGKPCADVGSLRLLKAPVTVDVAKKHLGMTWLNIPQGYGQGEKDDVDLIVRLADELF